MKAELVYSETNEVEPDADLAELIRDSQIAASTASGLFVV
jgi:hypothetical protein